MLGSVLEAATMQQSKLEHQLKIHSLLQQDHADCPEPQCQSNTCHNGRGSSDRQHSPSPPCWLLFHAFKNCYFYILLMNIHWHFNLQQPLQCFLCAPQQKEPQLAFGREPHMHTHNLNTALLLRIVHCCIQRKEFFMPETIKKSYLRSLLEVGEYSEKLCRADSRKWWYETQVLNQAAQVLSVSISSSQWVIWGLLC